MADNENENQNLENSSKDIDVSQKSRAVIPESAADAIKKAQENARKQQSAKPHLQGISTAKPRSSFYRMPILLGFVVAVLLFGVGVGIFLAPEQLNITDNRADETTNPSDEDKENEIPAEEEIYIEIESPEANEVVDGQFVVSGQVDSRVEIIIIEVLDIDGLILGKAEVEVPTIGTQRIKEFEKEITLTAVPSNPIGTINVFPKDREDSIDSIPISFKLPKIENKIEVTSLINNQILESSDVFLEGRIMDFDVNLIKLRITDSRGNDLILEEIQAQQRDMNGWSKFEEIIDISNITPVGNLKWQFYEEDSTGTRVVWLEFETQL